MIYLHITGNAGNQLFQYAFARKLMKIRSDNLFIDYRYVLKGNGTHKPVNVLRQYHTVEFEENLDGKYYPIQRLIYLALDKFLPSRKSQKSLERYRLLKKYSSIFEKMGLYFYDGEDFIDYKYNCKMSNRFVKGFWESENYFEDIRNILLEELTPINEIFEHNRKIYKDIEESESICVTVRRYDIQNVSDEFFCCKAEYYEKGVETIRKIHADAKIFIFSDDVNWCKKNLHFSGEVFYEEGENPIYEKLRLMSACKHFVISNSTFSWWAQYLSRNDNKIVVAPTKWRSNSNSNIAIYQKNWILMDYNGNNKKREE